MQTLIYEFKWLMYLDTTYDSQDVLFETTKITGLCACWGDHSLYIDPHIPPDLGKHIVFFEIDLIYLMYFLKGEKSSYCDPPPPKVGQSSMSDLKGLKL